MQIACAMALALLDLTVPKEEAFAALIASEWSQGRLTFTVHALDHCCQAPGNHMYKTTTSLTPQMG